MRVQSAAVGFFALLLQSTCTYAVEYTAEENIAVFFNHLIENKIEKLTEGAAALLDNTCTGDWDCCDDYMTNDNCQCYLQWDGKAQCTNGSPYTVEGVEPGGPLSNDSEGWTTEDLTKYWDIVLPETKDENGIPYLTGNSLMNHASRWDKYEEYWSDISARVQGYETFQSIKASLKVYFVETTARTFSNEKLNYGIVGLATDSFGTSWVFFPGAQGLQLLFGTDGDYQAYAKNDVFGKQVHQNYYREWQAVSDLVKSHVQNTSDADKVIFTGHSKGGLQAAIAAYEMVNVAKYHPKNTCSRVVFFG